MHDSSIATISSMNNDICLIYKKHALMFSRSEYILIIQIHEMIKVPQILPQENLEAI